jgi:glucosamine--fructose-6-phosphate aminotransferase (isomerizing)
MKSHMGIGHTRWATHGGVTDANAHPHLSCDKKIAVVHNGIVENYDQLKTDLISKGHTFTSETDSEVIVHLIEELRRTIPDLQTTLNQLRTELKGMNAVIAFFLRKKHFTCLKRLSNRDWKRVNEYFIASDASAILPHTKECTLSKMEKCSF